MKRAEPSARGVGVNGRLLRWARTEQQLTMREIRERGGPCPGYQCEVEQGVKTEVRSDLLSHWVRALNVTEEFARGALPVYTRAPAECRGLAGQVESLVRRQSGWRDLSPHERTRLVLRLIPQSQGRLPRVVLAYVLGIGVATLDAITAGTHPIMEMQMRAIGDLTALPEHFFKYGELETDELLGNYLPALRLAQRAGISPERLQFLILQSG